MPKGYKKDGTHLGFQKNNKFSFKVGDTAGCKNPNWKGGIASMMATHIWLIKNYGHPVKCEDCGKMGEGKNGRWTVEWSNCDHKYRRVIKDYNPRCTRCHRKYDRDILKIKVGRYESLKLKNC